MNVDDPLGIEVETVDIPGFGTVPQVSLGPVLEQHQIVNEPKSILSLATVEPGDEIGIEFNPTQTPEGNFIDNPPVLISVAKPSDKYNFAEGIATGGPHNWEDRKVRLVGSRLLPERRMAAMGVVRPQNYLEVLVFDETRGKAAFAKYKLDGRIVDGSGHLFTQELQQRFGWSDDKVQDNLSWNEVVLPQTASVTVSKPTSIK